MCAGGGQEHGTALREREGASHGLAQCSGKGAICVRHAQGAELTNGAGGSVQCVDCSTRQLAWQLVADSCRGVYYDCTMAGSSLP